jgi:transcriptional regulator with XRE-family HTH domain
MTTIKEIPALELDTIYRIMLKRIGKGYTAEQLSFLIGAPEGYIQEIETLERPFYTTQDLDRITIALEESNPESLFPRTENETIYRIIVSSSFEQGKFVHAYYRVYEDDQQEELFRLYEEGSPEFDDMMKSEETVDLVGDTIDVLIRTGYFYEPKSPSEIFKTINNLRPEPINSYFIQFALERFQSDGNGKLRIVGSSEESYYYEQC